MNIVRYVNTVNENGVRESTNGYYTGDKTMHGTITPDAVYDDNVVYSVELGTVRHGTIMGDAEEEANMPKIDAGEA